MAVRLPASLIAIVALVLAPSVARAAETSASHARWPKKGPIRETLAPPKPGDARLWRASPFRPASPNRPAPEARVSRLRSRDSAATRAYIKANYALVRVARANLPAGEAAIKSLATQVAGECPLAAFHSPQNHASEQLSNEVVGAIEVAAYQPDKASMLAFAHTVRGLRWSNSKLTSSVRAYATKLEGFPDLAPPNICADVKAWAASAYQTLPASTVTFDEGFYTYDIEAEEVSLRLLRPYESATVASLLHRTERLEAPLAEAEADAVSDYSEILDALKLNQ